MWTLPSLTILLQSCWSWVFTRQLWMLILLSFSTLPGVLFLPAIDFFIQNLFRHTLIIHIVHMTPPTDPPWLDKSENVNMAQDGFNFVTISQSPFSTQWDKSTDSSDHISLKDSQGLFICSFQGLDFSSICYHRSYKHSVQCHVTSLTE